MTSKESAQYSNISLKRRNDKIAVKIERLIELDDGVLEVINVSKKGDEGTSATPSPVM